MYARMVIFNLGPGMRTMAQTLTEGANVLYNAQKGFKDMTYFGDEGAGEYGSFSIWESKEDAEAAARAVNPKIEEAMIGVSLGPPRFRLFEVFKPNAP